MKQEYIDIKRFKAKSTCYVRTQLLRQTTVLFLRFSRFNIKSRNILKILKYTYRVLLLYYILFAPNLVVK